jgi:hypothetical protein
MKKTKRENGTYERENVEKEALSYRTITIGARAEGGPSSLDEKARSIEVVGATENPVEVWDWERFEVVREVCLMNGCVLPANRQVVLLDTHQRGGTGSVVGSYRDMHIDSVGTTGGSPALVGRAHFTSLPEGDEPYVKVKEGHVTDFSVGYRVSESEWVKAGETKVIQGRKFEGPLRVTTKWVPREMSVCPLGADEMAKARADGKDYQQSKEEQKMDKKLREMLLKRGMNPDATEAEAWAFMEKITAPEIRAESAAQEGMDSGLRRNDAVPPAPDAQEISRAVVRVERERVAEIDAMCKRFEVPDEERTRMVSGGMEIDAARKIVMDLVEKRQKEVPVMPMGGIEFGRDEGEKFRAAATDSLILRSGISQIKAPAPGADELRGYTLREMARLCLQRAGVKIPGNPMEMIGRAMMTGDFPILLAATANKSLFEGWESASESWQLWCATGSVSDFKTQTSGRASETDDLDEILEHGEYKYGTVSEAQEQYHIATFGKLFAITRQAIINDDLNALTDIPRKHGESWARKIGDLAYAVLTDNAAMGDGRALFIAAHANLGTAGVPDEITVAEAIKLMGVQKDLAGKRRLNIPALFFIAPKALEGTAEVFFNSNNFSKTNEAATRNNPYAGSRFTRVYESRLDDNSATQYYFAGPKGKTVKIFFLNGVQTPYLETKSGWTVDGVEYKVRGDAGGKAMDWKGLVRNAGA